MIYYIRDSESDRVKVGYAANPWRRLSQLQVSSPNSLLLVAIEPGDRGKEAQRHKQFEANRIRGEWFSLSGDLLAHVDSLGYPPQKTRSNDSTYFWGIPQIEVARATGLSQGNLSKLQNGQRRASPEIAIVLQRLTGVSAIKLVFGELADEAA